MSQRSFNGTTDWIICDNAPNIDNLATFTMACWAYPTNLTGDEFYPMGKWGSDGVVNYGELFGVGDFYATAGQPTVYSYVEFSITDAFSIGPANLMKTGKWQFIACTWAGGTATPKLYYGTDPQGFGEVASYQSTQTPVGTKLADATYSLTLGARDFTSPGPGTTINSPFAGYLAHTHIYNRVLNVNELRALLVRPASIANGLVGYHQIPGDGASGGDYTATQNEGTVTGTTTVTSSPPISGVGPMNVPAGVGCC